MSHIAVERNRRRQMNEHLKVLRSLTPAFYIKRGDQASIIGGAIDFIKELQTVLESLEAKKKRKQHSSAAASSCFSLSPTPSPRSLLTCSPATGSSAGSSSVVSPAGAANNNSNSCCIKELAACCNSPLADVEAKISGSNLLLRTLSRRIPGQAVKIIGLLESLDLEVLHVNISTMEDTVLHSFVIKIGLECQLSVDDLALEVQQTFCCQQEQLTYSSMAI